MSGLQLDQQLLRLSPKAKVHAGIAIGIVGAVGSTLLADQGWIFGGAILATVAGPLLAWTGMQELARQRRVDAEVARVLESWETLSRDLLIEKRAGRSVARYLQMQEYQEYAVRRWIARQFESATTQPPPPTRP